MKLSVLQLNHLNVKYKRTDLNYKTFLLNEEFSY